MSQIDDLCAFVRSTYGPVDAEATAVPAPVPPHSATASFVAPALRDDRAPDPSAADLALALSELTLDGQRVPDAAWDLLLREEERRLEIQKEVAWDLDLNPRRAFLGAAGEWCFWQTAGLSPESLVRSFEGYSPTGDGGIDHHEYKADSKCVPYWGHPQLWVGGRGFRMSAAAFTLSTCDLDARLLRYVGWVSAEQVMKRDARPSSGARVFDGHEMSPGLPPMVGA